MNQKKNNKNMRHATKSLKEILRRIEPYVPKPSELEPERPPKWEVVTEGAFPEMPSSGRKQAASRRSACVQISEDLSILVNDP